MNLLIYTVNFRGNLIADAILLEKNKQATISNFPFIIENKS